ncbi:MAG: polysaccharide export protein, partial [Woeseia sp.]|nr:polysaccharide export protein [Woeseia sp.]
MRVRRVSKWLAALILLPFGSMQAQENDDRRYYVQPGDILEVSVWREEDLQRDVLVRPDSRFSFPLVGDIDASNKTVEELKDEVVQRLERYIPEPVVTVTVKDILGNKIYLLGQV